MNRGFHTDSALSRREVIRLGSISGAALSLGVLTSCVSDTPYKRLLTPPPTRSPQSTGLSVEFTPLENTRTQFLLGGERFSAEFPPRLGVAEIGSNRANRMRFDLRPGDFYPADTSGNQRVELRSLTNMPFDSDVWTSLSLLVETHPEDGAFRILGQYHQQEDVGDGRYPPVFDAALFLDGSFRIITRNSADLSNGSAPTGVTRYIERDYPIGEWVHWVYRMVFSRSARGQIDLWRNGVHVFGDDSIPFGYNNVVGPYFKYGIYKDHSEYETTSVQYANVEFGTSSLQKRIRNPLPI